MRGETCRQEFAGKEGDLSCIRFRLFFPSSGDRMSVRFVEQRGIEAESGRVNAARRHSP